MCVCVCVFMLENPDLVTHVKNERSCSHSFWWVWVLLVKPNIFRGFYGPKRLVLGEGWGGGFEAYVSYYIHMSAENFVQVIQTRDIQ